MHRWMKWVSIVFLGFACAPTGCNNPIGSESAPQAPSNGSSGGSAGGAGSGAGGSAGQAATDGGQDVQSEAMPDASDVSASDAASDTDGGSSGAGGSDGSSGGSSGSGGIGGGFADGSDGAGGASGTDGGTGGQDGGGGIAGGPADGGSGSAGGAGSDAYTQVTYTFVTPGVMVKDHVAIWHGAWDANENILPRTPPYGPCDVIETGKSFIYGEAWDCNSTKCEVNQKSQIVCTVHVPKSSVVRADAHFYNNQADGGWSCTSMTGPSQGIFAVTGGSKNLPILLTKEDYPLPNTSCRFKYTAPAD